MVETSAFSAIALGEPERQALLERIGEAARPVMLATGVLEAVLAICRQKSVSPNDAYELVVALIAELRIEVVDFVAAMVPLAVAARQEYGAGRYGLNMGDCVSYAGARYHGVELLFKGDDFLRTDVNVSVGAGK